MKQFDHEQPPRTALYTIGNVYNLRWLASWPYIVAAILALAGALVAHYIGFGSWISGSFLALAFVSIAFIIGPQGNDKPKGVNSVNDR